MNGTFPSSGTHPIGERAGRCRLPSGMAFGTRELHPAIPPCVTRLGDHGATVDGMSPYEAEQDAPVRVRCRLGGERMRRERTPFT